ncbi:MAG: hypothetical protein IJH38_09325, partial [Clostridia bacterium]|nr:hypothetical protein [Clostridia bacterium]
MKRRLSSLYWLGIGITLFMAMVAIGVAAKLKIDDTRNNLAAMLNAASRWTLDSNEELQTLVDEIAGVSPGMRVTFLLDTGLTLADSAHSPEDALNHGADREISEARKGRIGQTVRYSPDEATFTMYMAKRLSPQLILRVSYPVLEIARALVVYGIAVLVLFLVLYWLQRRTISRLAADQLRQMEDVRRLLDGECEAVEAVFDELQPQLDAIAYRVRRLHDDYAEVTRTLQMRNDFVANASHELRSPLTSVRGFAEMLEEGLAQTPEEQALCIETIRSECDRMLEVIEDILHLSKAEQQKATAAAPTEVAPIAQEVVRALQPRADKARISLLTHGTARLPMEEREIWEVLYNLTDNAIRYGRPEGHVWIGMEAQRVRVADDGIGIAQEHLGRLFEPFYRVDEARRGEQSGTGLGLSIVRAVVQRRGGTISVESRQGEGTCFTITFGE